MAKAVPYIAAAGTFLFTGSFQAAQAAFVVSSAVMGLANKPKTPAQASQERQASVISLSFGEVPREVLLGHTITGGSLVDGFNHGGQYGTDFVTLCIALADHPTGEPLAYWVGENRFLFTGNGFQGSHGDALSMEFRTATATGYAPPAIALANGWAAEDRLCSISHIWVTYRTDEKVWTQGHPQFRFEANGLRVYDPRRDVRFGYTGPDPQTWEDTSTHTHSQNAALLRYAMARGVYAVGHQGDPAYLLVGRGLSEEEAPPLYTIAAANLCDEKVEGEDRYLAQGTIRASDPFIAVEEMFATAMGGTIIQRGGAVEVEPGQAKAAVATITDADLVVGEPVSYSGFLPDTDGGRANTVVPRYMSPLHRWQDHAGAVRRDVADIIKDGGPREITVSMPLVAWEGQAGRVAEMTRRLSRLERRMTLVLPPDYAWLEEGDWLAVQSDRRHGGATRRYRIEAWTLDRPWRMRVTLREISASVFGGVDFIADQADPPPPPVVLDALALSGVSIEAASLTGADGTAVPGVKFSWDAPVDRALREVRAEVRPVAAPSEISSTTTAGVGSDLTSGRVVWPVTNGVRPDAALEARLVPIGENGRPALATPWTAITAPGLKAGDTVNVGGEPASNLLASLATAAALAFSASGAVAGLTVDYEAVQIAAAEAAASAVAAAADRASAATAANTAVGAAEAAEADAIAAGAARDGADASAFAAAASASTASARADDAGEAANAASAAKLASETARSQAQTAATNAAGSETNAAGSAANASAAAIQSAQSRDQSQGFANAASGHASIANTKAGEAGVAATAAAADRVSAQAAYSATVLVGGNTDFSQGIEGWSGTTVYNPTAPAIPTSAWIYNANYQGRAGVMVPVGAVARVLASRRTWTIDPARRYRIRARLHVGSVGAGTNRVYIGMQMLDAAGVGVGSNAGRRYSANNNTAYTATQTGWISVISPVITGTGTSLQQFEAGTVQVALLAYQNNSNDAAAPVVAFDEVQLEDITESENAAGSATAAATQAANASASAGLAGERATAAQGSATQAATRAGEALTYRDQSAASASGAAGSAVTAASASGTAVTARNDAQGARDAAQAAAATAIAQSSAASGFAASAEISASLAAQANSSSPNLLRNGGFESGFGPAWPDGWVSTPNLPMVTTTQSSWGQHALFNGALTDVGWISSPTVGSVVGGLTYTFSCDVALFSSGPGVGQLDIIGLNAAGDVVWSGGQSAAFTQRDFTRDFASRVKTTFTLPTGLGINRVYGRLIAYPNGGTITALGIRQAKIESGPTATAYTSEAGNTALAAQLNITASVAADAQTRLSTVRFDVTGGAGGDPFQIFARADNSTSTAGLIATEINFANVVGGTIVKAMKLIGGEVFFMRPIYIDVGGRRLLVGPGSDWVLWFGPNTINAAAATRTNGYFCLGTDGKVYYGNAELAGGSPLAATIGNLAQASAPGGGLLSTPNLNMTITGANAATASVRWVKVDEVIQGGAGGSPIYETVGNNGRTIFFTGGAPAGGMVRATYLAIVAGGTSTVTLVVDVQIYDSN